MRSMRPLNKDLFNLSQSGARVKESHRCSRPYITVTIHTENMLAVPNSILVFSTKVFFVGRYLRFRRLQEKKSSGS